MGLQVSALSFQLVELVLMPLTAIHERESEQGVPSNAPGFPPAEKKPEDLNRQEPDGQGIVTERQTEVLPDDGHIGEDTHDVQPRKSRSECQ